MVEQRWEIAELIVALDPGIAGRLLAAHPADGWCTSCRADAPCSTRRIGEAAAARTSPASPSTPPRQQWGGFTATGRE